MELETRIPDPTPKFTSCVISDRPLNLSGLQLPQLSNAEHNTTVLPPWAWGRVRWGAFWKLQSAVINVSHCYGSDKTDWHSKLIIINSPQPWGYHSCLWPWYQSWVFLTVSFLELLDGVTFGCVTTQMWNHIIVSTRPICLGFKLIFFTCLRMCTLLSIFNKERLTSHTPKYSNVQKKNRKTKRKQKERKKTEQKVALCKIPVSEATHEGNAL